MDDRDEWREREREREREGEKSVSSVRLDDAIEFQKGSRPHFFLVTFYLKSVNLKNLQ